MKTPPGLLGAAVLFWGWQTGLLVLAVVVAVVLEASRIVPWRWELTPLEEGRISDLSTLVFVGLALYLAVFPGTRPAPEQVGAAMRVFQWMPLSLLPLMAAQAYSRTGTIAISAMLWARREQRARGWPQRRIDLSWIYLALSLAAASAANVRTGAFYAALVILGGWALWSVRSRAYPGAAWAGALALASILGYGGAVGLHALQKVVERFTSELFVDAPDLDTDPYRSHTSMGRIGALKLADRVVLRVEPGESVKPPFLLRDATYNALSGTTWLAASAELAPVQSGSDRTTWTLVPGCSADRRLTVSAPLQGGKGVLAIPFGACRIEQAPVGAMKRNRLGAVRVEDGPALVTFAVAFDPRTPLDGPPTPADLRLPKAEAPLLTKLAADLRLDARLPTEALAAVQAFFRDRFRYSTFLGEGEGGSAPLADFLRRSRSGHCEYFATATVLLLRAAGIPTRYATGYSVQEWSRLERRWIVRARHAHAWALAWVDGAWREVDTTPPVWVVEEEKLASVLEPAADLWAWMAFGLTRWWTAEGGSWVTRALVWLLVPLGAWLAWRVVPRKRMRRLRAESATAAVVRSRPGLDSEFYAIERALGERGLGRHPDEPIPRWLTRVEASYPPATTLRPLASLHARHRFDPAGLDVVEREALRSGVTAWLAAQAPPVPAERS